MTMDLSVSILIALIGPLVAYIVAVRQFSGRIKNSEASDLWEESRAIREWSSDHIKQLNEEIAELRARVSELEVANHALAEENARLKMEAI